MSFAVVYDYPHLHLSLKLSIHRINLVRLLLLVGIVIFNFSLFVSCIFLRMPDFFSFYDQDNLHSFSCYCALSVPSRAGVGNLQGIAGHICTHDIFSGPHLRFMRKVQKKVPLKIWWGAKKRSSRPQKPNFSPKIK